MMKTRKEALDEFLGWVNELGDSVARDVAKGALTRALETVWKAHTWRDYQSPSPLELTLTVNQRSYTMPDFFGRIGRGTVRNLTTGQELWPLDTDEAQHRYPSAGTSLEVAGRPCHYELGGIVGVQRQPAVTGEALEIAFTSSSDTDVRVALEGADEHGNERRVQVDGAGTIAVSVGTWSFVDNVGKSFREGVTPPTASTSSRGTMTLRKKSDPSFVLQTLFPEESAREHRIVTFYPKPSAADTIAVPVFRRPKRLLFDADTLPNDWWNAIFEEMQVQWFVNQGELTIDSQVPRPHLTTLIETDNLNRPPMRVRPWGSR